MVICIPKAHRKLPGMCFDSFIISSRSSSSETSSAQQLTACRTKGRTLDSHHQQHNRAAAGSITSCTTSNSSTCAQQMTACRIHPCTINNHQQQQQHMCTASGSGMLAVVTCLLASNTVSLRTQFRSLCRWYWLYWCEISKDHNPPSQLTASASIEISDPV